jgi:xylulokinase
MAPPRYILGIDLGTTTCRCAIFDLSGYEIAAAYRENAVSYPSPLWAEADPESWWRCTALVVREALAASKIAPEQIVSVGLAGLMHAPVLLDSEGQPVSAAILWMDQRCAPQCEAMRAENETRGRFVSTSITAPKLRWLAETHPELLARTRSILLPKDFVRYRLTGSISTDPSDASGTGLYDPAHQCWDAEAAQLARAPLELLPPIQSSWTAAGSITVAAAQETGLMTGTVVAVGGGDTFCTLTGLGELAAHEVCIYLGTAAWLGLVDRIEADGCPAIGSFGATATTGAALRWLRDLRASEPAAHVSSYDTLMDQAGRVAPGAEGLFFLPHMMGERGPEADPAARGAFVGLTLRHSHPQLIRAVLEGSAFQVRKLLEARIAAHWHDSGPQAGAACGGVARSPLWMQLLVDVIRVPLRVPAVVEAGVLGAAILGGVAAGVLDQASAARRMVRPGRTYQPNVARADEYEILYARYCELDDLLMPWFRASSSSTAHRISLQESF